MAKVSVTDRPNEKVLTYALDMYRGVMRVYIVKHLKAVQGTTPEKLVIDSLKPNRAIGFEYNIKSGRSLEDAIDISDFPKILSHCWKNPFDSALNGDRTVLNLSYRIRDARNEWAYPSTTGVNRNDAIGWISNIATVLRSVGQKEHAEEIEKLRDGLIALP